ncbi:hypothetical protein, partial [Klebsiella pneumoniae]|uniref:hypothetical protein n=1 Tax=Klebsiella pneumoniae TaxID=573 RepID=UPI00272EF9DA
PVTPPAIKQPATSALHPEQVAFGSNIIHHKPLKTGNIAARARRRFPIVPATPERRGDSREGKNRARRAPGPSSWLGSPPRR